MEQGRDGGTCARNLSLTMLGHVWHTHIPKCPLLLLRQEAHRHVHDVRHGAAGTMAGTARGYTAFFFAPALAFCLVWKLST